MNTLLSPFHSTLELELISQYCFFFYFKIFLVFSYVYASLGRYVYNFQFLKRPGEVIGSPIAGVIDDLESELDFLGE